MDQCAGQLPAFDEINAYFGNREKGELKGSAAREEKTPAARRRPASHFPLRRRRLQPAKSDRRVYVNRRNRRAPVRVPQFRSWAVPAVAALLPPGLRREASAIRCAHQEIR